MKRLRAGYVGGAYGLLVTRPGEDIDTALNSRLTLTDADKLARVIVSGQFSAATSTSYFGTAPQDSTRNSVSFTIILDRFYNEPPQIFVFLSRTLKPQGSSTPYSTRFADTLTECKFQGDRLVFSEEITFPGRFDQIQSAAGYYIVLN